MTKNLVPLVAGIIELPENNLNKAYVVGSHCAKCNEYYYPKRKICLVCGNRSMDGVKLSGKGKIWSFTTIFEVMPGSLIQETPYVLAVIELEEKVLLRSILENPDQKALKLGTQVGVLFERISEDKDGNGLVAIKFKVL